MLKILNLFEGHKGKNLLKIIIQNMKKFILKFGKNFTFMG